MSGFGPFNRMPVIGTIVRILVLTPVLALSVSAVSLGAVSQTVASTGGAFGPSGKAEKHPKSATGALEVPTDLAAAPGGHRLCADYSRPAGAKAAKGNLSARVEVTRGGAVASVVNVPKAGVSNGRARSCTAESVHLEPGDLLLWKFTFKGMPKVPSGDIVTFVGEVLAPGEPFGSFRVIGGDQDQAALWIDGANLVFCRTNAGFADLWIRLAAERGADGENAPHVDIDVCNYAGGGKFSPLDPQNPSCAGGKTFDVFWHDEEGDFFVNAARSSPCQMTLVDAGSTLEGVFGCEGLGSPEGGSVDILGGAFRCSVE